MRTITQPPSKLLWIVRACIIAGVLALGFVAIDQSIRRVDERARGERLCLIEAMLAVKAALTDQPVEPDLPPACRELADKLGVIPPAP